MADAVREGLAQRLEVAWAAEARALDAVRDAEARLRKAENASIAANAALRTHDEQTGATDAG